MKQIIKLHEAYLVVMKLGMIKPLLASFGLLQELLHYAMEPLISFCQHSVNEK